MKIEHRTPTFSSSESSIIESEIHTRLHRITFQSATEIGIVARQILFSLSGEKKKFVDFFQLHGSIGSHFGLTAKTRKSLFKHLKGIEEIYSEPELWIQPDKITEFRYLIASKIDVFSKQLLRLNSLERERLLSDQKAHIYQEKVTRKNLKHYSNVHLDKSDCTLSEIQQEYEHHIATFIEDLDLLDHRDSSLPLHDDHQLLIQLMLQQPTVFIAFAPYFNDNEIVTLQAINSGYCTIDHVSDELRARPNILAAYRQKRFDTLLFCRNYYLPEVDSAPNDLDELYGSLNLEQIERDLEETIELLGDVVSTEELYSAQAVAESCFDYQNKLEEERAIKLKCQIHFRVLINDLVKKEGTALRLEKVLSSVTGLHDRNLMSERAQKFFNCL